MKTPKTKQDLENLIRDKIEENLELDYKDPRALSDTKEIAKDVSAMANSAGGIIVYGIAEESYFPTNITPINRDEFSKEKLEQIITSNISPKIDQIKIIPIDVGSGAVYVVEIPQSTTAHQNTKDQRYYKRRNFKSEPMFDYEIRDVMNRAKFPIVELEFEMEKWNSKISPIGCLWALKVRPLNKGNVYANFVNYFIELPKDVLAPHYLEVEYGLKNISEYVVEWYAENVFRDLIEVKGLSYEEGQRIPIYGPSRFDPILPGLYGRSEQILFALNPNLDDREIKWRVHADNSPVQVGSISLNKIPFKKNAD